MADPTLAELIAAHEETVSTGNPAFLSQLAAIVQLSVLTGARVTAFDDLRRYVESAAGVSFDVWRQAQTRAGDLLRETQIAAPVNLEYSRNPMSCLKDRSEAPSEPSNDGGLVAGYTVSPALPTGLSIHATTGVISGTPSVAQATANYVVTATNSAGTCTATVAIVVAA